MMGLQYQAYAPYPILSPPHDHAFEEREILDFLLFILRIAADPEVQLSIATY